MKKKGLKVMNKEMEIKWMKDDYKAERILEQRKPDIYPYVEKVKELSETGFNMLLASERDWYILRVYTLHTNYRPITMYIVGYAPKFTKIINDLKED
jgi:hypothetical protein